MHSDLYQLIELGLGVLMLLGLGVGAKLLFWDLPARWFGRSERRITQLEERYVRMLEAATCGCSRRCLNSATAWTSTTSDSSSTRIPATDR